MVVDIFWLLLGGVNGGGYTLAGGEWWSIYFGWWCVVMGGNGWWWIYFGWWWVVA